LHRVNLKVSNHLCKIFCNISNICC